DFVGGQVVRVEFAQPVRIDDLRTRVQQLGVGEASIQALGNTRTYQVRLPKPQGPESASNQVVSKLRAALPKDYPGARVDADESVVIYDRIRENLRKYRKMAILPLLNLSLNETLARTVVTSLTVLIALGVLMLIGPEVIFGLAIAIFLGVLIGTYSSIYISAPVLVWLGVKPDSFLKTEEKEGARPETA